MGSDLVACGFRAFSGEVEFVFSHHETTHLGRSCGKLEFVTPANADQGGTVALTGRQCCADRRRDRASFNGPGEQSFTDGQQIYASRDANHASLSCPCSGRTTSATGARARVDDVASICAQIDLGSGDAPRSCIICDISNGGAKLTIGPQLEVPDEFSLWFRRRCRVMRRDDGQIGVRFVPGQ